MPYSQKMDTESRGSSFFKGFAAIAGTVVASVALRGELLLIVAHILKLLGHVPKVNDENLPIQSKDVANASILNNQSSEIEQKGMFNNFGYYWMISVGISLVSYFTMSGYYQWAYYIRQKDCPEKWKCQPDRWLSAYNEKHAVVMGTINMFIGGTQSSILVCYIMNGRETALYYTLGQHGWLWEIVSVPLLFLTMDMFLFYSHKTLHHPLPYKYIHKWHHRYHSPTAFSALAMHPIEMIMHSTALESPAFLIPTHAGTFIFCLLYVYYYGIISHSGIMIESIWPWQPHSIFHDDHHKYFHCNFGFNTKLFDWLHGTIRRTDRLYTEDTFGGQGKIPVENSKEDKKSE
ncbi:unnamed protein product [Owenia fusiformis]|uniref:Fatty acid hydroxylase domain-containing protein n=1 Tax=Owenia fusiformis TaxID=6347 RepID=A0A8S4N402_OWEFU|nr:unnamed protein product [Owenia fusiformis]